MVERAAPIACTARISLHQQVFVETLHKAITADPAWQGDWYPTAADVQGGMDRTARIVATAGWSPAFYQREHWRSAIGMSSLDDVINGVMNASFEPMDRHVLLCQIRRRQRADLSRYDGGDLAMALALQVIGSPEGHMGRNGFEPGHMAQVGRYLTALLAS